MNQVTASTIAQPFINTYSELARKQLNSIEIDNEPDLDILLIAMKSIYDPSKNCEAMNSLIEKHRIAIQNIKELLLHPEVHNATRHTEEYKKTILTCVAPKILQISNVIASYTILVNEYLDSIPVATNEDFRKVTTALETLVEPSRSSVIDPSLTERIQSIKELLDHPELYAVPLHQPKFKTIILGRIRNKITEFTNFSRQKKREYIEYCKKMKELKELAIQNRLLMRKRKAPDENSEAHVITEEQQLLHEALRFESEYESDAYDTEEDEIASNESNDDDSSSEIETVLLDENRNVPPEPNEDDESDFENALIQNNFYPEPPEDDSESTEVMETGDSPSHQTNS